jgi:hypothetical protein
VFDSIADYHANSLSIVIVICDKIAHNANPVRIVILARRAADVADITRLELAGGFTVSASVPGLLCGLPQGMFAWQWGHAEAAGNPFAPSGSDRSALSSRLLIDSIFFSRS